jgi:uncharacterized protein YkwD
MRYVVGVLVGLAAGLSLVLSTAGPVLAEAAASEYLERVVELTNAERVQAGLAPLRLSPELSEAAQAYAEVLATSGCFAHTCGPVAQVEARSELAGYRGWRSLGENIAGGQLSPERVLQMWMESPGHRSNILNPGFTEFGVGLAAGGEFGLYWAQMFGTR